MILEGRLRLHLSSVFGLLVSFGMGASALGAQTTVSGTGSPTVSQILQTVYTNGETFTRVEDYVGGAAANEGQVLELVPVGGLTGRTDQTWQDGIISASVQAKFAGFNHTLAWERNNVITELFAVFGSGYDVSGGVSNVDLSGGPFRWMDRTGFNDWSSDVTKNNDGVDHMVTYRITGGSTTGTTWMIFFDDENGGGDRDFNDMAIEIVVNVVVPTCAAETIVLTDPKQPATGCNSQLRPDNTGGQSADFVITARTQIQNSAPTNPAATGQAGKVFLHADGLGVKTSSCGGSAGISGSGGDQDEELIFTFDSPAPADAVTIELNKINFSDDTPVIFISSMASANYDYTILEAEINTPSAFTSTGSQSGEVAFAGFPSLPNGLLIDGFKVRETAGHIFVRQVKLVMACGDNNVCTTDSCVDGVCVYKNNTAPCSDNNACTTNDVCSGGACGGTAMNCNDNKPCTVDSCSGGSCTHTPAAAGTACGSSANTECDNPDTCNASGACLSNNEPAGFACGNSANTDCTDPDTCNGSGTCLSNDASNGTACSDGKFCTDSETCTNGTCGGGSAHSCKDALSCTTDTCDETNNECDHVLQSGQCLISGVCYNNGAGNPGNQCQVCNPSANPTGWSPRPAGTACGSSSNTDCDNPDTCNGSGVCQSNNEPDGTACPADTNDCTNDVCTAAVCTHPAKAAGTSCGSSDNTDCDNPDTCNGSGVCQANNEANGFACTSDGNACTNDVCKSGACAHPPTAAGTACGSSSNTDCDNPDTCNGAGACQVNNEANGFACTSDSNACTNDVCKSGVCAHPPTAAGTACGSSSNTDCDNPDTCSGAGVCQVNNEANGFACTSDGNECTNDVCTSGACTHAPKAAGTACGSASNTDCDNPDTCNGSGSCQANNEANGFACTSDGNDCTNDVCKSGACTHPPTAAGTSCGSSSNTDCDNPDTCNGAGVCQVNNEANGFACTSDGNDCTNDACKSGACTHAPKAAGTACGSAANTDCDNPDTCNGAGVCQVNNEANGFACTSDGNECTNDVCKSGACTHPPKAAGTTCGSSSNTDCDNPDTCNGAGSCQANNEANGFACTSDGNECTNDVCTSGACTHAPKAAGTTCGSSSNTDCDNPDTCDGMSVCVGNLEPNGTTCTTDGNDCTNDVCVSGACTHPPKPVGAACGSPADTDCDDPNTCNGAGMCQGNNQPNGTTCTDDGDDCSDDVCAGGVCTHPDEPDGTACNDGNACTTGDICTGGVCAGVDTSAVDCNDMNACTNDSCHPTLGCQHTNTAAGTPCGSASDTSCDNPDTCNGAGMCQSNNEPDGTACPDGLFCNGNETCAGGACTGGTPVPDCCKTHGECDDDDVCNGDETCVGNACVPGTPLVCNDGNECTADSCDPVLGCVSVPVSNGTPCDDGQFCTVGDTCTTGVCSGSPRDCSDALTCTTDSCDEVNDVCDHVLDPGYCLIAGVCYAHGDPNPANECQQCNSTANTGDWSNDPSGSACGLSSDTPCDNPDTCNGAGMCISNLEPPGTACGDPTSTDCDNPDTCDGAGNCADNLEPANTACGDMTDTDCDDPDSCDAFGVCQDNLETVGTACGDPADTECDNPDTCDSLGMCQENLVPAGTACGSSADTDCDNPDTCDGSGSCEENNETDGTTCTDDGNACRDDVCSGGACTHPPAPEGTACGSSADTDCSNPDTCNASGTCQSNNEPDGTTCTSDGIECTDDVCASGSCSHPPTAAGAACGSPADNDCDNPDTCDGAGGCDPNLEPPGHACGNSSDTICTNPDTCDGTGVCQPNHAPDGTACDDGLFCFVGEICTAGDCGGGSPRDCSDGLTCTTDSCDEVNDECDHVLIAGTCLIGGICYNHGDGNPGNQCEVCDSVGNPSGWSPRPAGTACGSTTDTDCDNPDTCNGSGMCVPNNEPDGTGCTSDGIECTNDVCSAGVCTHPNRPAGTACGSSMTSDCDNPDTCDASGVCQPNNDPDGTPCASDGNVCTTDACAAGVCTNTPVAAGTACGSATNTDCDNPDTCDAMGVCQPNYEPPGTACGDPTDNVCTDPDTCDGGGACMNNNVSDGTPCDDGQFCTVNEVCTGGVCGGGTSRICPDDLLTCTAEVCDEVNNECDHNLIAGNCLIAGVCYPSGAANPGNACEVCDPVASPLAWSPKPAGTACGSPSNTDCDNPDTCDGAGACRPNGEPDGTACTADIRECTNDVCSAGVCAHPLKPAGTACGSPADTECDNPDTCDSSGVCRANNKTDGLVCASDGQECTNDVCSAGVCTHANKAAGTPCGSPLDTPCDDPDTCNGSGVCTDNQAGNGTACDDGAFCTLTDVCLDGTCAGDGDPCPGQKCSEGTDTCVACLTDDHCDDRDDCTTDSCMAGTCTNSPTTCVDASTCPPGALCTGGVCECPHTLDVCLDAVKSGLPAEGCFALGAEIEVEITFDDAPEAVAGASFYIAFDADALNFVRVEPEPPFTVVLQTQVDQVAGTVFYAAGVPVGQPGIDGPAVVATLIFVSKEPCESTGVCFLPDDNPYHTRLVAKDGTAMFPDDLTCCDGPWHIDAVPPVVACPGDIIVNADCDSPAATVTFPPIVATDNCDGPLAFNPPCTATYWASGAVGVGPSVDVTDHLTPTGGVFAPGITQIICTATDTCGQTTICDLTVTVTMDTTLDLIVQLSPVFDDGPLDRCIEFELYSDCVQDVLFDGALLTFGLPLNLPGHAGGVSAKIPAGQYACITAKDPLHTLRSVASLTCDGTIYKAVFKGDPFLSGNWLTGGNLNGDHVIDILDFGVFLGQMNQNPTPDPVTICGSLGPHADINGDGVVDIGDFTFIQINFFAEDKDLCCPEGGAGATGGLSEISLAELERRGLGHLSIADLNGDQWLTTADMTAFLEGVRPRAPKPGSGPTGPRPVRPGN